MKAGKFTLMYFGACEKSLLICLALCEKETNLWLGQGVETLPASDHWGDSIIIDITLLLLGAMEKREADLQ